MISRETMKEVLLTLFEGWCYMDGKNRDLKAGESSITNEEAMTFVTGDELVGNVLSLFGEWSNDLVSIAPYFGIGFDGHDGEQAPEILRDIPPPPDPTYYYDYETRSWIPSHPDFQVEEGPAIV